jgi:NAD(P)-dependent dehydrogenase (short-subunit alcohol dehydrogenase family)
MATDPLTSLVVGASRGLGLGLCARFLERGHPVIGTVRDNASGTGLHALRAASDERLEIETVDITDVEQIAALAPRLGDRRIDILMVNGGVAEQANPDFEQAFFQVMATNVLGAMNVVRAFSRLMADDGALAVMSSGLGSVAGNTSGGWEPYRSSKAALNQALRSFAAEHDDAPWSVTAIAPGWVRTDMGGAQAPLDVETSTRGVADVLEGRRGARGCAFLDYQGQVVPW